ncbi:MAG TPA: AAA family ATPase [Pyrinomonadaceae bacterium]|jgi:hypothetical protein|nr:AAA family ATPase [Pyrinomonadaceae bacterium]
MLKIRAIKLEVVTVDGEYGAEYFFDNGLNIIRGNNSTGKSSLFQAILYGLGFEELLGGKNEKTMQSVLKDEVEFPVGAFHKVIQSFVYLEIENRDTVTIKRSIASEARKSQLVDVYFGPLLTENKPLDSKPMYVHDKGGASDEIYGFHSYLASFLEWDLPEVMTTHGNFHKLYLQQIAPAFFVEQKAGWSDFFATTPYYEMRNTRARVVEFLLELDVFENQKLKQQLYTQKQVIGSRWDGLYFQFLQLAYKHGATLKGLEPHPTIITDFKNLFLTVPYEDQTLSLPEFNQILMEEFNKTEKLEPHKVGENVKKNEEELNKLVNRLNKTSLNYELLSSEMNFDLEKLKQYQLQLVAVNDDLKKNKGAFKVTILGAALPTKVANNICPTCQQPIKESLLPHDIEQRPMGIEENISFLEAQQKMLEVYIEGQIQIINEKQRKMENYLNSLSDIRQTIRDHKKELIQDERLPSTLEIQRRLKAKNRIESISRTVEEFSALIEDLKSLTQEFSQILKKEKALPKEFFSDTDKEKLESLKDRFIQLLNIFKYSSSPIKKIHLSPDNYLPEVEKITASNASTFQKIIFDSSASDFIRCIWAFTLSLLDVSLMFKANHPQLLVLDEPKQQDISMRDFKSFLQELSKYETSQILVFASFENLDGSFEEATNGLNFKLKRINPKLIKPTPVS